VSADHTRAVLRAAVGTIFDCRRYEDTQGRDPPLDRVLPDSFTGRHCAARFLFDAVLQCRFERESAVATELVMPAESGGFAISGSQEMADMRAKLFKPSKTPESLEGSPGLPTNESRSPLVFCVHNVLCVARFRAGA